MKWTSESSEIFQKCCFNRVPTCHIFSKFCVLLRPRRHFSDISARSCAKENVNSWCEPLSFIFLFQGALRAKSKVSQVCVTSVTSWAQGFLVMKWCSGSGRHHFRMSFKLQDYSVKSWSWQQNHQKYFKSVVLTGVPTCHIFSKFCVLLRPRRQFSDISARSCAKENVNSWCEALSSIFLFQGALRAKSKVSQVCVTSVTSWAQGFLVMKWCSGGGRHHFRMSFKLQEYNVKSWSGHQNHQKYLQSVVLTGSQLVTCSQNSAFSFAQGDNFQTFRRAAAQKKM